MSRGDGPGDLQRFLPISSTLSFSEMSQRHQRQMTDLEDPCANVSATEPSSYIPALILWPQRSGLQNFPTWEWKEEKKMAKGRCVLFSLKRNFSSDRQPLRWCSRYANVGFCYTQSKSSFKQDMSMLPKQEQSQMLSKKLHCDPM